MDYYSNSSEQLNDEEYKERNYPTRQEVKREREKKQKFAESENKKVDEENKVEGNPPSKSRSQSPKSRMNIKMPRGKLALRILAITAVFFNIKYVLNFMKVPYSSFDHTLFVVVICVAINFIAVWILFYKRSFIRLYLSLFAILCSVGYYFYVNYTFKSFLGNNLITTALVGITVLFAINPKVNYYMKSFIFLLVPIIGIYISSNKFALVWTLMCNAGLILIFRISKGNKKEARKRKEQKQPA